jgi:hypothetical protein
LECDHSGKADICPANKQTNKQTNGNNVTMWPVAVWLLVKWTTVRSFAVIMALKRLRPALREFSE